MTTVCWARNDQDTAFYFIYPRLAYFYYPPYVYKDSRLPNQISKDKQESFILFYKYNSLFVNLYFY